MLEIHCSEIQNSLGGSHIFSVANGYEYCTALLKTACCYSQQLSSLVDHPSQKEVSSQGRSETLSAPTFTHPQPQPSSSSSQASPPDGLGRGKHTSMASPNSRSSIGELLREEVKTSAEVTPSSLTCTVSDDSPGVAGQTSKPSQSQGIPITGPHFPRRHTSVKRNSLADNSPGSHKLFGTSEGKYGSFLQDTPQFNSSSYSSSPGWSIWNTSSIDGLMGTESSLKSWVLVTHPTETDQSGRHV